MHELALSESILQIVLEHAKTCNIRRIRTVRLEIGTLACVEPDALRFCFGAVTRGTVAEGAELDIVSEPGEAWCWDCSAAVPIPERAAPCPRCGGYRLAVRSGEAMRVKELEVE